MFGGIWLLVGTVITIAFTVGGGPVWNDLVLDRRGLATDATPTAIEPTGSRVNGRTVFRIAYTFTDRDGVARTGSTGTTNDRLLASAERRERLPVEYDPQAPLLSRVAGERASFFGWFILLPLGFAVVGAVIAARGLRSVLRVRQTYVHGHAILADVTAVVPTSMSVNRRRVMRVDYSVQGDHRPSSPAKPRRSIRPPSARASGCSTDRPIRNKTSPPKQAPPSEFRP